MPFERLWKISERHFKGLSESLLKAFGRPLQAFRRLFRGLSKSLLKAFGRLLNYLSKNLLRVVGSGSEGRLTMASQKTFWRSFKGVWKAPERLIKGLSKSLWRLFGVLCKVPERPFKKSFEHCWSGIHMSSLSSVVCGSRLPWKPLALKGAKD